MLRLDAEIAGDLTPNTDAMPLSGHHFQGGRQALVFRKSALALCGGACRSWRASPAIRAEG
jgi:hypothetical protein